MIYRKFLRKWFGITFLIAYLVGCSLPRNSSPPPATLEVASTATPIVPTSTAIPIHPSFKIIGDEELVYDWSTDRCADNALPDLPVRAFRDAEGMVQLNLSFTTNYRLIGPDLESLRPDCAPTLVSIMDKDPSHFSYSEWVGSTYTLDGRTVYALIHNEFYGSDSSLWYAQQDFGAIQDENDWHYQGWNGSTYSDMRFDSNNHRWQGNRSLCQIGSNWTHPDLGCEPTRTWVSPVDATIVISGSARDLNAGGGNGVIATIHKGDEELWSANIKNGDNKDYAFSLEVQVRVGDEIHFRVNANGDPGWDSTYFNPKINIGFDPCVSEKRENCSQYAITFAISTDGGRTYNRPPAPNHLVATLPYRYAADWGFIGMWQPSNIVHNPKDGYYYVLIQHEYGTSNVSERRQGSCVLRTKTLDDPTSWRAWDGEGFNMRMIDPYVEPNADPAAHTCQIVSHKNLGYAALNYNLTYNSFFDKFLLVGHAVNIDVPGFYFSLSDDLVNWSPIKLLMAADLAQTVNWQAPFLAYPSLIDPDSPSINFDVTGQTPYLYFTRINGMDPLDFDLVRVRIEFGK